MEILLQFLATKALAALIGVVALLGVKKADVTLTKPEIKILSDSVCISTTLKNGFPEKLEKIILSGTPVTIRLTTSYSVRDTTLSKEIVHRIRYDLANKTFLFVSCCRDRAISSSQHKAKDMDAAKKLMNKFNVVIPVPELFLSSEKVIVIMRVTIDPVKIEAIGDKEFELMAFWDYHTPTLKFVVK